MTNKEKLKKVISKDFDKEKNYNLVLKKLNHKKLSYVKYSLVPICLLIITFSMVIRPKTMLRKITENVNNNDYNINNSNIGNYCKDESSKLENIYITSSSENSWVFDVSDTDEIVKKSDYILKVEILSIENGTYKYTPKLNPTTPIYVKKIETLKGNKDEKINFILKRGGKVTIKEVIENIPRASADKMGLTKLSEEEQKSKYMIIEESGNFDLEIGKTYVVALNKSQDGYYYIVANGYGVFNIDGDIYTNYITGNKLIIK